MQRYACEDVAERRSMDLILWRHAEAVDERRDGTTTSSARSRQGRAPGAAHGRVAEPAPRRSRRASWSARRVRCQQTAQALGRKFKTRRRARRRARAPRQLLTPARWPDASEPVLVVGHQPTLGLAAALLLTGVAAAVVDQEGRRSGGCASRPRDDEDRGRPAGGAVARLPLAASRRRAIGGSRQAAASARLQHAGAAPRPRPPRAAGAACADASSAQPARDASVGCAAVARAARSRAGSTSPRAWQTITARRRQSSCQANVVVLPAAPRACAGRRAGRAPGRRCRRSWLCEKPGASTWRQQVGAVAVVVVVRDHHARSRAAPQAQPSSRRASLRRRRLRRRRAATSGDRARRARPARCRPRSGAAARAPTRRACRAPPRRGARPPGALAEVEDHALAQRAARRLQRVDAEVRRQRVEDRQAAADAPARRSSFRPGSASRSALPASRQRSHQPAQARRA